MLESQAIPGLKKKLTLAPMGMLPGGALYLMLQNRIYLGEMLADLPTACDVGCKKNSKGYKETWTGYKLHIDVACGQIPVSCVLTSVPGSQPIGANISGPWIGTCVFFAEALADDGTEPPSGFAGKRRSARA